MTHEINENDNILFLLQELTKDEKLTWFLEKPTDFQRQNVTSGPFLAKVGPRRVIVYSFRYKHFESEYSFSWRESVSAEIVDDLGNVALVLIGTSEAKVWELLRTVQACWVNPREFARELERLLKSAV